MKTISISIFLMISLLSFGQEYSTFLRDWESHPVPTNEDTIRSFNRSQNDWFVFLYENEIRVVERRTQSYIDMRRNPTEELPFRVRQSDSNFFNIGAPFAGLSDFLEVEDGFLLGFNRGEDGEFYWFSKDGTERYQISELPVMQLIKRDNTIFAIEGMTGMVIASGSILQVENREGKWIAEEYVAFQSYQLELAPNWFWTVFHYPLLIGLDSKNNFIVVTNLGVYSVDKDANLKELVTMSWEQLFPSSMVIQNDIVYIGMRKGVFGFDLATKESKWLLPQ